mgnify:FL=1
MTTKTKSYKTNAADLIPNWHVIDAKGKTLGRISSEVAVLLQGKHKPTYVPYLNTGDYVIVINTKQIHVTGNKLNQKMYYRHSGYMGGLKQQNLSQLLEKSPTQAVKHAVKGMLPKNTVGKHMLSRLKLYSDDSHPHQAQLNARPKKIENDSSPQKTSKNPSNSKIASASTNKIELDATSVKADTKKTSKSKTGTKAKGTSDKSVSSAKARAKTKSSKPRKKQEA